jgi:serine phosphatase RsbU (regulator of sigma subunit)/anti-anti-sigma regulatory factor
MEPESAKGRLLIVDDDPSVLRTHARVLSEYEPLRADDGLAARALLSGTDVDVVLCDLSMPGLGGIDLMRWAKENCPHPLWIVVSGQDTFDAAAQALKLGAFDFLCKPILPIQLRAAVAKAIAHQSLVADRACLVRGLAENNLKLAESLRNLDAAYQVLREQRSMLDQDLHRAERIMRALLPHSPPTLDAMQLHVGYRPSNVIGGDLYGATMLDEGHLAVYVADAAGHGVSAALLAVLFKQRLRLSDAASGPRAPAEVLAELNGGLLDECKASGLFVTVAYALIDTVAGVATIASAGHPPSLVLRRRGGVERIEKTGPALGLVHEAVFGERCVSLSPGDRLFFYTDGLTDSLPDGHRSLDGVLSTMDAESKDGGAAIDHILALTERSTACEDDITLLLVTANAGASTIDTDRETMPPPPPAECVLRVGGGEERTWIALEGRATWKHAPALRDACLRALEGTRDVVVDLEACTSLDSTLLGTLHELVARTDAGRGFRLQNAGPDLRALFAELDMRRVLASIVDAPEPLPVAMVPIRVSVDAGAHALVLRAHELLAQLSPGNALEFGPVIEALRRDVASR